MDSKDARTFVKKWIKAQKNEGRGQGRKIAEAIGCSTVLISQFLSESRQLSLEQGEKLARFMQLSRLEMKYFMLLLQRDRAGTKNLADYFEEDLSQLRLLAQRVDLRLNVNSSLSKEDQTEFYSSWHYSAIRLLSAVSNYNTPEDFAQRLQLSRETVSQSLEFLLRTGLCIQEKNKINLGPQQTHLSAQNPLSLVRQIQWRTKAFSNMQQKQSADLFYTAPLTISKADYQIWREKMVNLIKELNALAIKSNAEELYCFQFDLFAV